MIFFEPQSRDRSLFPHDPFKALLTPRPIGRISTVSAKGEINLVSLARGESEFTHARLESAPSRLVHPPRVAASPRQGRVDSAAMRPIARGGDDEYSVVERVFSMPRPA